MNARRFLGAAASAAVLIALTPGLTKPATATDGPVVAGCSGASDPVPGQLNRKPVVYVHGFASSASVVSAPAEKLQKRLGDDVEVLKFDYASDANKWADETAISACLASYIARVSMAHTAAGGDGRVGAVGHSMGGLAIRFASAQRAGLPNGARVGSVLAGVVTLATPHQGSPWGSTGFATIVDAGKAFFGPTGIRLPHGGRAVECLAPPQRRPKDCAVAPYLPAGVPLTEVGTNITVDRRLFKVGFIKGPKASIPLGGDGIVPLASALGYVGSVPGQRAPRTDYEQLSLPCTVESEYLLGKIAARRSGSPANAVIAALAGTYVDLRLDAAAQDQILDPNEKAGAALARLTAATMRHPCFHTNLIDGDRVVAATADALKRYFASASVVDPSAPPPDVAESAPGERPVMIVLDLSDSMNDGDEDGNNKLAAAKFGLNNVIRAQPPGAKFGLFTFPAGNDDCASGRVRVPIGPLDTTSITGAISALNADGGTPTGPALQAATNHLRARGFKAGTLLLVTDGESNCGANPCQVATDLADQGFDVRMDTMGIAISDEGRREMECVAQATGGSYYDVDNSEDLGNLLAELSRPALDLTVTFQDKVPPRGLTKVRAELRNTSGLEAPDVLLSLTFPDAASGKVPAQVLRPRQRVGNLPIGGSVVREWVFTPGASPGDSLRFRVIAQSAGTPTAVKEGLAAITEELTLEDAGPLLRRVAEARGSVAIMGDSYSAGEGAGDYAGGTNTEDNTCHRSPHTYATELFDPAPINLACSGAVSENFLAPQGRQVGERAQLDQLASLKMPPDLVLLTLGGNDVNFAGIVAACLLPNDCSDDESDQVRTRLAAVGSAGWALAGGTQYGRLRGRLADLHAVLNSDKAMRSRKGRIANIILLAYPQVTPEQSAPNCPGFSGSEIRHANQLARVLNQSLEDAVERATAKGVPVYFAEDVERAVLPNHTLCDPEPYINPVNAVKGAAAKATDYAWVSSFTQELVHPNKLGYRAMTNALVQWSRGITPRTEGIAPGGREPQTEQVRAGRQADMDDGQPSALDRGARMTLRARDMRPGWPVLFTARSIPRALALVHADEEGVAVADITVPRDLGLGDHTLVAEGAADGGRPRIVSVPVELTPRPPAWQRSLLIGSGTAAGIGAIGLLLVWRGLRRRTG